MSEIIIKQNNCIRFDFLNSNNGTYYKSLECSNILKCCFENEAFCDETFAYFVLDIFVKELNEEEIKSSFEYFRYGFGNGKAESEKMYMINIIGTDICIDIICGMFDVLEE